MQIYALLVYWVHAKCLAHPSPWFLHHSIWWFTIGRRPVMQSFLRDDEGHIMEIKLKKIWRNDIRTPRLFCEWNHYMGQSVREVSRIAHAHSKQTHRLRSRLKCSELRFVAHILKLERRIINTVKLTELSRINDAFWDYVSEQYYWFTHDSWLSTTAGRLPKKCFTLNCKYVLFHFE